MLDEVTRTYAVLPRFDEGHRLDFDFFHPELGWIREYRSNDALVLLGSQILRPEYGLGDSAGDVGETRYLTVQHILSNGEIADSPRQFVGTPPDDALLLENDILIARTGFSLGKAALITPAFAGSAFGSFCLRLRMRDDAQYVPGFVVRFLNSRFGQAQIRLLRTGSDKPNINTDQVNDLRLPPIQTEDQERIIEALREIEEQARQREVAAAAAMHGAERLFVELLGLTVPDRRPPSYFFEDSGESGSVVFAIVAPSEGRLNYLFYDPRNRFGGDFRLPLVALSQAVEDGRIITGEQPEFVENGPRVALKTVDVSDDGIDSENALRVSDEFFEKHAGSRVESGDIVVTATGYGSLGKVAVYGGQEPALISGELLACRPKEEYSASFVAHWLRCPFGRMQFDRLFSGSSGQIHLYESDFAQFLVPDCSEERGVPREVQERVARGADEARREGRQLQESAVELWAEARRRFETLITE